MPDLRNKADRAKCLRECERRASANAKNKRREYDLPEGYAETLWNNQHGHCAVTNLRFHLERFNDAFVKYPYGPSIDRIDSKLGYAPGNVRLVCVAVNFGLGQWGDEMFLALAKAAAEFDRHKRLVAGGSIEEWRVRQLSRIAAAEEVFGKLPPEEQPCQRHRIAGLKAALTKGPKYMSEIAFEAAESRRRSATAQPMEPV